MSYATLYDVKTNINTAKDTENDALLDYATYVSWRIDGLMASEVPYFEPYLATDDLIIDPTMINSWRGTLMLPFPYISITSVTVGTTTLVIDTNVEAYPSTVTPIRTLRLIDCCQTWYDYCMASCCEPLAVSITGVRGYRRRGGNRWTTVGTLTNNINSSDTTFLITGQSGHPETLTFSSGCLMAITTSGATEYMRRVYDASAIVVSRAINGTTAAAHTAGDSVLVWNVEETIRRATARQAGLLLARRGAYDVRGSNDIGTPIQFPQDMLHELNAIIQMYGA